MAEGTLNVVSICGSLRKGSYNRIVMNGLPGLAPDAMQIREAWDPLESTCRHASLSIL